MGKIKCPEFAWNVCSYSQLYVHTSSNSPSLSIVLSEIVWPDSVYQNWHYSPLNWLMVMKLNGGNVTNFKSCCAMVNSCNSVRQRNACIQYVDTADRILFYDGSTCLPSHLECPLLNRLQKLEWQRKYFSCMIILFPIFVYTEIRHQSTFWSRAPYRGRAEAVASFLTFVKISCWMLRKCICLQCLGDLQLCCGGWTLCYSHFSSKDL
jgi:hypothetical protein